MKVRQIDKKEIEAAALRILKDHGRHDSLPVNVEVLVEQCGANHIPIPKLLSAHGVEGTISENCKAIYIDRDLSTNRYRFTLAHELGHIQLHRELILERFEDPSSDRMTWEEFTDDEYRVCERQAHLFAGAILLPEGPLQTVFDAKCKLLKAGGAEFESLDSYAKMKFLRAMGSDVGVSNQALRIRLIGLSAVGYFDVPQDFY